jgi:acetyl esterase/lipase
LVREIANKAHVAIVFVNYTPSPEARYPVALEQAYAATKWVAQNGQTIHVNPSRLALVGDSVGGNMAAALAILAKERGGPKIAFQVLFYPVTDGTNFNSSSYIKLENSQQLHLCRLQSNNSEDYRLHLSSQMSSMYFTQRARHMLTSSLMQVSPSLQSDILIPPTTF